MRPLDREETSQHNLTVVAMDHGSPRRSATQLLLVQVLDVNDEAPAFEGSSYEARVAENLPAGTPVLQLHATDWDLGKQELGTPLGRAWLLGGSSERTERGNGDSPPGWQKGSGGLQKR